jgi:hypothetical protein
MLTIWTYQIGNVFFILPVYSNSRDQGNILKPIELKALGQKQSLCIIRHLREYFEKLRFTERTLIRASYC